MIICHSKGSIIHNCTRYDGYSTSFGPGDIIGCYINIDSYDPTKNEIRFYLNGIDQGIAFPYDDVVPPPPDGIYYPAISLFNTAAV